MAGFLCLTSLILSSLNTSVAEEGKLNKDIAIADFVNISEREKKLDEFKKTVPELILTDLANDQRLLLVTRRQLNKLLEEMALAEVGIVDPQTAARVGKAAGARYMFIGTLSLRGIAGENPMIPMSINTQLVEVESSRVIGGWRESCDKTNVDEKAEKLTKNILKKLFPLSGPNAAVRSLVIPGWGQRSNDLVSGYFFATGSIAAIGGVAATQMMLSSAEKDRDEHEKEIREKTSRGETTTAKEADELEDKKDDAEKKRSYRNISLIALASVWGLNVIDAYIESHRLVKSRRKITERVVSFRVGADAKSIVMTVRF